MLLKNLKPSSLPEWKRLDKSREDSDKRTTANLEAKVKAQAPNLHRSLWLQECLHPLIMPHNSSPRQTPGFSSLSRMACLGHTRRWEQPPPHGSYSAGITPHFSEYSPGEATSSLPWDFVFFLVFSLLLFLQW